MKLYYGRVRNNFITLSGGLNIMKKKVLSLILTTLMVAGVMVGCSGPSSTTATTNTGQTETSDNTEEGSNQTGYDTVIIGIDDTFAPMGFRDDKNELTGFDIELAKAVSEIIGFNIEFQPIDWSMKETEINAGNIDLIWNGYTITDKRKEQVLFSRPYLNNRQVVLVLAESGITDFSGLEGKVVATQAMSSSEEAILTNAEISDTFKELVTFGTYDECLRDMDAKRTDAVVADEVLIRYYVALHADTEYIVLEDNFGDEEYGIGARKEDAALIEAINAALDELKTNGVGAEISEKWFAEDILQ